MYSLFLLALKRDSTTDPFAITRSYPSRRAPLAPSYFCFENKQIATGFPAGLFWRSCFNGAVGAVFTERNFDSSSFFTNLGCQRDFLFCYGVSATVSSETAMVNERKKKKNSFTIAVSPLTVAETKQNN